MEQIKITRLKKRDVTQFAELISLFEDVFEMKDFTLPAQKHLQKVLGQNNFHVWVAVIKNKIVGGLTSYIFDQYYSEKPLAYIYDLAVQTSLQRQGIGKKLISAVIEFYKKKGFEEVFLQADKIDQYAIDFYRSTLPAAEEQVVHFYYTLNKE